MASTILIKNALILTSADAEPIERGSVLVRQGRIARVGRFIARADMTIDAEGGLLMPGLIQGHIHLCQTLFRGLGEDMALLPWLRNVIWPLEAVHDEESIYLSALLSCAELIKSGTTAFLSIETVRHTRHVLRAVHEAGMAGVIGHCLMDETGGYDPLAVDIEDALADLDVLRDEWEGHPRIRLAVAPRFALSCSARNMRLAAEYARENGLRLHTHSSEQIEEVELVRTRTGLPNIEYLHSVGLTGPDVGLAHCVHTEPHERDILRETGTSVLHCPSANLKLGSGIAPIPEYLQMGINVALGADGAPCNNRLDPFLEMREAGLLQKIRLGPAALPAREIVRMATEGGARALGWQDEMGTLEVGKRANLILVDPAGVSALPSADPLTNLVYSHAASDVRMTMVDGRILYEDGELTTIDEERLRDAVLRARARLMRKAGLQPPD
ncbi:MAG: amidohydrolase family protein [Kiritimatiellae bacterium]|nr:amidohydrolase family protein [Kiritimatiellia bacterium]MDW8458116.1 amidohydrolase family protein [Verrucomicrobiota bacterium]